MRRLLLVEISRNDENIALYALAVALRRFEHEEKNLIEHRVQWMTCSVYFFSVSNAHGRNEDEQQCMALHGELIDWINQGACRNRIII